MGIYYAGDAEKDTRTTRESQPRFLPSSRFPFRPVLYRRQSLSPALTLVPTGDRSNQQSRGRKGAEGGGRAEKGPAILCFRHEEQMMTAGRLACIDLRAPSQAGDLVLPVSRWGDRCLVQAAPARMPVATLWRGGRRRGQHQRRWECARLACLCMLADGQAHQGTAVAVAQAVDVGDALCFARVVLVSVCGRDARRRGIRDGQRRCTGITHSLSVL